MNENVNVSEDVAKHGRRASDNKQVETGVSSSSYGFRSRLFSGFVALGGVTALLAIGRASNTLDTVVKDTAENTKTIKEILVQNKELLVTLQMSNKLLEERDKQQIKSDERFEKKLDKSNSIQERVLDKLQSHDRQIFILNQKVSVADKVRVQQLAMR